MRGVTYHVGYMNGWVGGWWEDGVFLFVGWSKERGVQNDAHDFYEWYLYPCRMRGGGKKMYSGEHSDVRLLALRHAH